jgi:hypothetical protein
MPAQKWSISQSQSMKTLPFQEGVKGKLAGDGPDERP